MNRPKVKFIRKIVTPVSDQMIQIFKLASITTLVIPVAVTVAVSSVAPSVANYRLNFQVQKINSGNFQKNELRP